MWNKTIRYLDRYLFSFLHLLVFAGLTITIILNPEMVFLFGENIEKLQTIIAVTLPLSYGIDYLRKIPDRSWSMLLGVSLLFFILTYFAFGNFSLPTIEFNYYNLLYVLTYYFFTLILVASAYFRTMTPVDAWNEIIYVLYSFGYAVVYSLFSVAGILLIIFLLDRGFEFDLSRPEYMQISVLLFVIFYQFYFLYIKSDTEENPIKSYPAPLLIFTSYVLFPLFVILSGIVLVILYMLLFKGYQGQGWVGYILLSYLILGILIFFLIFPIRNTEVKFKWVAKFPSVFSYISIPLGLLIVYDVYVRVNIMGFTEPRYLFFWAGVLALFWGVQNLVHRQKINLKRMGSALLLILTVVLYGPLNMSVFSNRSQTQEIMELLESYHLIGSDQKLTDTIHQGTLHPRDRSSLSSKLDYLQHKQYSAYRMILPGTEQDTDPYQYFNYRSDPQLMMLISSDPAHMYIYVSQDHDTRMTYSYPTDSFSHMAMLDFTGRFSNIRISHSAILIDYLPISGYQIELFSYLRDFTDMLKLSNPELLDSNIVYFEDEKYYVTREKLSGYGDTLPCKLIIEELGYTSFEDSFDIKELKAHILY